MVEVCHMKLLQERVRLLVGSPGSLTTPIYSPGSSSTPIYSPGSSTPPRYSPGASTLRNGKCSNCKHLLDKITVLGPVPSKSAAEKGHYMPVCYGRPNIPNYATPLPLALRRNLQLQPEVVKNITLFEIEQLLCINGSTLRNIDGMPYPDDQYVVSSTNRIRCIKVSCLLLKIGDGGMFFLYGYGGTGKTFIWKTLSAALRSKGEIVLNVASSGIATLLLSGGRTAHSRFAIPINIHALQEKVEQATIVFWATFVAQETPLNDKSPSDVAPILIDFLVKVWRRVSRATCRPGNLSTLHFLKFSENSLEGLKILENKLESMKILENKLESLKLQENQPVDGLVPLSIKKYIQKCLREAVKEYSE
ncbi:ATP-dependent DNA helicase PIF1-like protein [Tanacetum coccineum]